ncbi:MAG: glycosyltransferase [Mobilitalea sp.]
MNKIKVLQFPIGNAKGGITQYAMNNWEYIDRDKFQFDFATLSKKLDFEDKLIKDGCRVHYITCYAEENEEQFTKEMNHILEEGYDVIHLHTSYWKSFLVEEIANKRGVPKIIVHSHSTMIDILDDEKREEAIRLHMLRRSQFSESMATEFVACSKSAADWLYGDQISKHKIRILKNAIDVKKFDYNEEVRLKYRKDFGLEDCFVLGNIGRFAFQKNHEFLIDLFNEVYRNLESARLLLIGTGELENDMKEKVLNYGIQDKVLFLGKRDDVNNLFQAMDLFVLPSNFEGLALVLIEAQAAGLKCIASAEVSKEVAVTKNIGFLPLSQEQWINKIIEYSDGYQRECMRDIITKEGYNIADQIIELEKFYSEFI